MPSISYPSPTSIIWGIQSPGHEGNIAVPTQKQQNVHQLPPLATFYYREETGGLQAMLLAWHLHGLAYSMQPSFMLTQRCHQTCLVRQIHSVVFILLVSALLPVTTSFFRAGSMSTSRAVPTAENLAPRSRAAGWVVVHASLNPPRYNTHLSLAMPAAQPER